MDPVNMNLGLTTFSSREFDVKEFINRTFHSLESSETEMSVSSYAMKLQIYLQQLNAEMEGASSHLIYALPRIMRDIEILTEEALVLKEKMDSVKQEIAKVEQDTGNSIQSLERIDQIKTELLKASQALHEADNWTVLGTDVEAAFNAKDIDLIASNLVSMQQSLQVLASVKDYTDKKRQLEKLKDKLEKDIRPLLLQSFIDKSTEKSKKIVHIFIAIKRLPEALSFISEIQKNILQQQWDELLKVETERGVVEAFRNYYDAILSNWFDQIKWCDQVLPDVPVYQLLIESYTSTLNSLSSEMTGLIDKILHQILDPVLFLTELKVLTKQFAASFRNVLDNISTLERKEDLFLHLAKAIYFPYVGYVSRYNMYEEKGLLQQSSIFQKSGEDITDIVSNLLNTNSKVFDMAHNIKKRCYSLTEKSNFPGLFKSIEYLFGLYLKIHKNLLNEINKQQEKFDEFSMFQLCLTFLQSMGDFFSSAQQMEKELVDNMIKFYDGCTDKDVHPFLQWHKLLLNASLQNELHECIRSARLKNTVFSSTFSSLRKLCKDVHKVTFHVIFAPISAQLKLVKTSCVSQQTSLSSELPDYSFVPQEYITQIGQYFMTLPQHLKPFLINENSALTLALSMIGSEYDSGSKNEETSFADIFLGNISHATCKTYSDFILDIDELSAFACKQIAADIEYLGNVLNELGFSLSKELQNIVLLLRLSPGEYIAKSSGCNLELVAAVRRMRNIKPD